MNTIRIALLSVLSAVCLAIQLLPRPMNVEFTSLITFTSGMVFGSVFGASLGAGVMFVNGFLSPYGTAGVILPFQMAGMIIVGVSGGLYSKLSNGRFSSRAIVEVAILGATLTFIYDVVTNIGTAVSMSLTGLPFHEAIIAALISGIVPSVIHIVWNTALFSATAVPLVNAIQKVLVWR